MSLDETELKWLRYAYRLVEKQRNAHRDAGDVDTVLDLTNALAGLLLVDENAQD